MVQAYDFPLGSVLLHKTGLGNQWAVSQVVGNGNNVLTLSHLESSNKETHTVDPKSDDILPLVLHSDVTIVLGNGQ